MSVKQLFDLSGRVAIVTGGSRGLGLQMAEALGEMGAILALTARKRDELDSAVDHLTKLDVEANGWVCDVGKREQIPALVDAILARHGRIDVLVNNAGATWGAPAEEQPLDGWDKLISVNLTGAFVTCQQVAKKAMIPAKRGRILITASTAGLTANDPRVMKTVAYNATKHGVVGMMRQMAAEWGIHGITVNAICPGVFPSKMSKSMIDASGTAIIEATPTRRLGNEEDLKGLAVLLASDASRQITGQAIVVDGGATII